MTEPRFIHRKADLQVFPEIGQPFHGIVVVAVAGLEAELQIETMSGAHRGRRGIEKDGLASGGHCALKHCLGQGAAQAKSPRGGPHPKSFQFPRARGGRLSGDCPGEQAPGDEARGPAIGMSNKAAAALLMIGERQPRGFLFKTREAKARRAGLGNDKAPVFEQQFSRLRNGALKSICRDFLQIIRPENGLA